MLYNKLKNDEISEVELDICWNSNCVEFSMIIEYLFWYHEYIDDFIRNDSEYRTAVIDSEYPSAIRRYCPES